MAVQRDIERWQSLARRFRRQILETISIAGSGHPGGSLSAVEILIALYYYQLNHKPDDPEWPGRDRFIMSKGHASPLLYVTLANCGYFPETELATFRTFRSRLQGHVHTGVPGVEFSTGSLGQGLSVANGLALGARIRGESFHVYCLLGDGEIQEGQIWEAAMSAAHHRLHRVCAIVDCNGFQENGPVEQIKREEPLGGKWRDFGWQVLEINGHDLNAVCDAFDRFGRTTDRPTVLLARTVKGKGVSFMEGRSCWHGKAPDSDTLARALQELI